MAFTLPIIDPCCVTDCTATTAAQVPGPPGPPGEDGIGSPGAAGKNAYTVLTVAFTMPAEQANGQATMANTGWMIVGQNAFVQGLGSLGVVSIDSATKVTLKNLYNSATGVYATNSVAGTIAGVGSRVGPGGEQGPTGAAYSQISMSDGDEPPTDPTAAGIRFPVGGGTLRQWPPNGPAWV